MHLTNAFHGRSGYTLSLTNTDPVKTDRFPKFGWPRIDVPAITFPLDAHLEEVIAAERRALQQAEAAFAEHPHDIACFLAEPIQAEGGDNHMRAEFLQAMQRMCRDNDALFVLDEVQTGVGLTGTPWAYQQLGLEPDVVAFGKKVQLGGIMAGRRVDEVPGTAERDSLLSIMREQEKILLLPCGPRSIRFRPALTISTEELSTGLKGLDRALGRLGNTGATPSH